MTPRVQSKNRVPYGGLWQPKDPLTGEVLSGTTFKVVLAKAVAARKANGLPVGLGFEQEVEEWCCAAQPLECVDVDPLRPRRKRLTLDDVVRGAKVLLAFKRGGSRLVDAAEAERRAAICKRCPLNSGYQRPCAVCQELADVVRSITGGRQTSADRSLHVCHVCGCSLKAAVWMELEDQCKGVDERMRKEFAYMAEVAQCWKSCATSSRPAQATSSS
jgi:hypothetical protein